MFSVFSKQEDTSNCELLEREIQEKDAIIDQKDAIIEYSEKKIKELEEGEQHIFLGKLLHTRPDGVCIYRSSVRQLFPNVRHWEFNRPLDKDHVLKLKDIIQEKQCLEGHIDILDDGNELCIVNGQHRFEAIFDLMKDATFDREIITNVHKVSSLTSDEANEIFLATNNIKNVQMSDNPEVKFQHICMKLQEEFPNGITKNKSGKANMWRLDIKQLYNLMQYNDYFNNPNNSEEILFQNIIDLNNTLSVKPYDYFFGKKRAEKFKKQYKGACDSKFFMGLHTDSQLAILFQTSFKEN